MFPIFLIASIILTITSSVSTAAILHVPAEYTSIGMAVQNAESHDTILVEDGDYPEYIECPAETLTIASNYLLTGEESHIAETILTAARELPDDTASIIVTNHPATFLKLIGVTIRDGNGTIQLSEFRHGGGIYHSGGRLDLIHCNLTQNRCDLGTAIWANDDTDLYLTACNFFENGDGLICQGTVRTDTANVVVDSCRFHHNTARYGAALLSLGGNVSFSTCRVDSNINPNAVGTALILHNVDTATVIECFFTENETSNGPNLGSASFFQDCSELSVQRTIFENNHGYGNLAIGMNGCTGVISDCEFRHHTAVSAQGVISFFNGDYTFRKCIFDDNTAPRWSVMSGTSSTMNLDSCTFTNNISFGAESGAAILVDLGTYTVRDCIVEGNLPAAIATIDPQEEQDFRFNYFGDPSGPYHAVYNPSGSGDTISGDSINFIPWLTEPPMELNERPDFVPCSFDILTSYPNPFNSSVTFEFSPRLTRTEIRIYDLLGRAVTQIHVAPRTTVAHWTAESLPSGIYIARLDNTSHKLVYLK